MRVLVVPRPHQHLLLSVPLILPILVSMKWWWSQPLSAPDKKVSHTVSLALELPVKGLSLLPFLPPQTVGSAKFHSQIQWQKAKCEECCYHLRSSERCSGSVDLTLAVRGWGSTCAHRREDPAGRTRSSLSLRNRTSISSIQESWDNPLNLIL